MSTFVSNQRQQFMKINVPSESLQRETWKDNSKLRFDLRRIHVCLHLIYIFDLESWL